MKVISKRLQRLETLFAPRADKEDAWGGLANVREEMLNHAARLGEPRCSEIRTEMDTLGPEGLWREAVRSLLMDHGFVQNRHESLAETVARAVHIGTDELRVCIAQGKSAPLCWTGSGSQAWLPMIRINGATQRRHHAGSPIGR
jgi:hypothetical protein